MKGAGSPTLLFCHGFGCDQNMWRFVTPRFEASNKIVLFDTLGAGRSDLSQYDFDRYAKLEAHAVDILEICRELNLENVVLVGHSVGATTAILAAVAEPDRFAGLVLVAPSPCYLNVDGYRGGFNREDLDELLEVMDSNYLGWSQNIAPVIMGNADRPELASDLANSFCRTDPTIARHAARATFLSDHRAILPRLRLPSMILQCADDAIAPIAVGEYMRSVIPDSELVLLNATGHCPNLSAPEETSDAIARFLADLSRRDATAND